MDSHHKIRFLSDQMVILIIKTQTHFLKSTYSCKLSHLTFLLLITWSRLACGKGANLYSNKQRSKFFSDFESQ